MKEMKKNTKIFKKKKLLIALNNTNLPKFKIEIIFPLNLII